MRLGADLRSGALVDAGDFARRVTEIEIKLQARVDEREIWLLYLNPPRSWVGRGLMWIACLVARGARGVG
jgi:hypothetical protein